MGPVGGVEGATPPASPLSSKGLLARLLEEEGLGLEELHLEKVSGWAEAEGPRHLCKALFCLWLHCYY